MLWNSKIATKVTKGQTKGEWEAKGISIDTRELNKGDLFLALQAERDGHNFVNQAFAKGASAAMVSKIPENFSGKGPLLIVEDVLVSLEKLAQHRRKETKAKIVALTGSVGKTSTKSMLTHSLSKQGKTHAAVKSFNNHIGVPLSLARMPIDSEFGVFEIGMNNPGEIEPLSRLVQPHVTIVTTVGKAHIENFNSVDEIAREKSQIFKGLVPKGKAIINAMIPTYSILERAANEFSEEIITFGVNSDTNWTLTNIQMTSAITQFKYQYNGHQGVIKLGCAGEHFAWNALATLATIQAINANYVIAGIDLGNWSPPEGRGVKEHIYLDPYDPVQSFQLIDDSFNANPISLIAGLKVLALDNSAKRRVAILSDMLELGSDSREIHESIAKEQVCESISKFHCIGENMKFLFDKLPHQKKGLWFSTAEEMALQAHALCNVGDTVLVKGSKGSKAFIIAQKLKSLDQKLEQSL